MRILVTGGYGFIGSAFVRHMAVDHDITVLDKLTYAADPANLEGVKHRFVRGDICDREVVESAAEDMDLIAHFAAETHVDRSIDDPGIFVRSNVLGTQVLLEQARKSDQDFLYISTDEVYGPVREGVFCSEDAPLMPTNPYSASKAGADRLAYAYFRTYGIRVVITRSSNNYGSGQHKEKFVPTVITHALTGKDIPIYGTGRNIRDWLYVEDNVRALELAIRKGHSGDVYNISSGTEMTNLDVAKKIIDITNSSSKIKFVTDRKGHDYRYGISSEKIRELGWIPQTNFDEGLKKTVKWYASRL